MADEIVVDGRKLELPIDEFAGVFKVRLKRALEDPKAILEEEIVVCANVVRALRELKDLREAHRDIMTRDETRFWR